MSLPGFVQLDRHVLDLHDLGEEDLEVRVARSLVELQWGLSSSLMTWDDLLADSQHAVVLGEPGAGKSWELRALAERLSDHGAHADFVRLELLLDDPRLALHSVDLTHGTSHILLLDALDETKLKSRHALEHCLAALRRESGAAWCRLRLVLSCRVSDWQPEADGATLARFLPDAGPADSGDEKHLRVVGLAPLTDEQITLLARARGVSAAEEFLQALAAAGARDLCGRPRDVVDLAAFWSHHGRLGTLSAVLEDDLERKLRKPDTRREPAGLSLDEARRGAEDLAAAMILGRTFSVRVPDEQAPIEDGTGALDPTQALPGWSGDGIQTLLARPVFDEATLGRVRFHHRTVGEYLAASWARRLLSQGCPWRAVQGLLFSSIFGREVVLPGMAPVAAWLAAWEPRAAAELVRLAPSVLLRYGDPQALSIEVRQRVLRAFAQRYRDRVRFSHGGDWAMLARFADEALAPTILDLLREHAGNAELCAELMGLAAAGSLSGGGDAAVALAVDASQGTWVRLHAIDLVVKLAAQPRIAQLLSYLEGEPAIEHEVLYKLWSRLFPAHLSVEALLQSMRKHREVVAADPTTGSGYALDYLLVPQCPADELVVLLSGLRDLAAETEPGGVRAWLIDGLGQTTLRVLRELPAAQQPLDEILAALDLFTEIERHDHRTRNEVSSHRWRGDLRPLTEGHVPLRRAFFWHRHRDRDRLRRAELEPLGLIPQDVEWLLGDLEDEADERRRRIALRAALNHVDRPSGELDRLTRAVADSSELTASLEAMLAPPPEVPPDKYELERLQRAQHEQEVIAGNREFLSARLDTLRAGSEEGLLCQIAEHYDGECSKRSDLNWARMEEHLGPEVLQAAQRGFAQWWQGYEPPVRGGDAQATLGVSMGLAGLERFFALGGLATDLTPTTARRAAVLATWELNEVPPWLDSIAAAHPDAVRVVLTEAIRADLEGCGHDCCVLGKVAHRAGAALELVAPHVVDLLVAQETTAQSSLKAALTLVTSRPQDHERLAGVLPDRVLSSQGQPTHLLWLVAWLAADADGALGWLEQRSAEGGEAEADQYVLDLLAFVHEGGLFLSSDASVLRPNRLARFIDLAYGRVRRAEDENPLRSHRPSRREDAQQGRSLFLQTLGKRTSEEAYRALTGLTRSTSIGEQSTLEWIEEMAQQVAERLAQGPAWRPADVATFARLYEVQPRTASDLFRLVLDRLNSIAVDLESADFSQRELFRPNDQESVIQKWLALRLQDLANGRYTVHREEEVDAEKEPDIRVHAQQVEGRVCVEIKRANKYSYPELLGALETQLVGQYLRDRRSNHGVLFLANQVRSRRWEPSPSESLSFAELVTRLQARADEMARSTPGVQGLQVLGVELAEPAIAKKKKTAKKKATKKKAAKKKAAKKKAAKKKKAKKKKASSK